MSIAATTSWDSSSVLLDDQLCTMPKKQLAVFVIVDLVLVATAIVAALRHVKVLYVMLGFIAFSVVNGVFLIVTVVRKTEPRQRQ